MTGQEIEAYRKRLNDLTKQCSDEQPEKGIRQKLKDLAREVGASTYVLWVHPTKSKTTSTEADTSELIRNIHQALQTATMVNMCKSASKGYKIAEDACKAATKAFWITCTIAFLSMLAAYGAVVVAYITK